MDFTNIGIEILSIGGGFICAVLFKLIGNSNDDSKSKILNALSGIAKYFPYLVGIFVSAIIPGSDSKVSSVEDLYNLGNETTIQHLIGFARNINWFSICNFIIGAVITTLIIFVYESKYNKLSDRFQQEKYRNQTLETENDLLKKQGSNGECPSIKIGNKKKPIDDKSFQMMKLYLPDYYKIEKIIDDIFDKLIEDLKRVENINGSKSEKNVAIENAIFTTFQSLSELLLKFLFPSNTPKARIHYRIRIDGRTNKYKAFLAFEWRNGKLERVDHLSIADIPINDIDNSNTNLIDASAEQQSALIASVNQDLVYHTQPNYDYDYLSIGIFEKQKPKQGEKPKYSLGIRIKSETDERPFYYLVYAGFYKFISNKFQMLSNNKNFINCVRRATRIDFWEAIVSEEN